MKIKFCLSNCFNMKLWEIEEILNQVKPFKEPKVKYEQYITTPHISSCMIYTAENSFGDINDKEILGN